MTYLDFKKDVLTRAEAGIQVCFKQSLDLLFNPNNFIGVKSSNHQLQIELLFDVVAKKTGEFSIENSNDYIEILRMCFVEENFRPDLRNAFGLGSEMLLKKEIKEELLQHIRDLDEYALLICNSVL